MVKVRALDVPPPGALLNTVTLGVPAVAISAALIWVRNSVLLTNVVARSVPFHLTIDTPYTKLVPLMVR